MREPTWISIELARAIHQRQLAEHGGADGVRDAGLLESALARPQQKYAYSDPPPTLAELAAAYAFGIARNHPFIDGNKRTAYVVCRTFLILNGLDLAAGPRDRYLTFLSLAAGDLSEDELTTWLAEHTRPLNG